MAPQALVRAVPASPAAPELPVARPRLPALAALAPYLQRIDEARWYSNFGPLVCALEDRFAARFGGAAVSTVSNGTQALILGLKAMGVEPGGLCAMPSWTFIASAHAAHQAGLVPWFLDVDAEDWMLRPATVRAALANAPGPVSAVMPVAAFGARPDLDGWTAFHEDAGLPVLIDAAAAFDTMGSARLPFALSLHATKLVGAGEGGCLVSDDAALMERFRRLTSFGFKGSRESPFPASNAKLSEYAAAVAMAALDAWPAERTRWLRAARLLRIALSDRADVGFQPGWGLEWVSTTCVVRLPDDAADRLEARLAETGIATRRWWGEGCHQSPAFAGCPHGPLPTTERLARSTIGLPFAIDLEDADIDRIAHAVRAGLDS